MDTFSHAAWGFVATRWRGSVSGLDPGWLAALAGAAPDLLFYLPYAVEQVADGGFVSLIPTGSADMWKTGGPPLPAILARAYTRYYVYTHSLVLLGLALLVLLVVRRRDLTWLGIPYGLHILMDIPTHERFAVQPFFPLSDWAFVGLSWGDPRIFWPQLAVLIATLTWLRRRRRARDKPPLP